MRDSLYICSFACSDILPLGENFVLQAGCQDDIFEGIVKLAGKGTEPFPFRVSARYLGFFFSDGIGDPGLTNITKQASTRRLSRELRLTVT